MINLPFGVKIIISLIWDFIDFTVGRIPGLGSLYDIVGMLLATFLWGPMGILALWEVLEVTDQLDAEIPTLTLMGLASYVRGKI